MAVLAHVRELEAERVQPRDAGARDREGRCGKMADTAEACGPRSRHGPAHPRPRRARRFGPARRPRLKPPKRSPRACSSAARSSSLARSSTKRPICHSFMCRSASRGAKWGPSTISSSADCDSADALGIVRNEATPKNREKGRPGHQRRSRRQRELVELLSRPSQKRARDRFDHVEFLQCDRDLRRVSSGSAQQI